MAVPPKNWNGIVEAVTTAGNWRRIFRILHSYIHIFIYSLLPLKTVFLDKQYSKKDKWYS